MNCSHCSAFHLLTLGMLARKPMTTDSIFAAGPKHCFWNHPTLSVLLAPSAKLLFAVKNLEAQACSRSDGGQFIGNKPGDSCLKPFGILKRLTAVSRLLTNCEDILPWLGKNSNYLKMLSIAQENYCKLQTIRKHDKPINWPFRN